MQFSISPSDMVCLAGTSTPEAFVYSTPLPLNYDTLRDIGSEFIKKVADMCSNDVGLCLATEGDECGSVLLMVGGVVGWVPNWRLRVVRYH